MGFSIGPINLTFLEAQSWDVRRQVEMVNVPFSKQTGFTVGSELVSYQLTGAFHADDDDDAKVLRRQLNELFNNPDIDFEYIEFDLDDEELSGWFLLDSINTQIIPGVFGDYPFSCSVRRLGNPGSLLMGTYWKSSLLENDFSLTEREWVALIAGAGLDDTSIQNRFSGGGSGSLNVAIDPNSQLNSLIAYRKPLSTAYYVLRCQMFDTVTPLLDYPDSSPDSSNWVEIFGPEHSFIEDGTSSGDVVFSNGYIMIVWHLTPLLSPTSSFSMYSYDRSEGTWIKMIGQTSGFSGLNFQLSGAGSFLDFLYPPTIEHFDYEKIVWNVIYTEFNTETARRIPVKFTLRRGTWFVSVEMDLDSGGLSYLSDLRGNGTHNSFDNNTSTSNYQSTLINSAGGGVGQIGFFHTEALTHSASTNGRVLLNTEISSAQKFRFGIFAIENPLPSGITLADLGQEYLADMNQQLVLVDPKWL